jgi:hypothetical protein
MLVKLRQFFGEGNPLEYLKTEHRQNLLDIQDKINSIELSQVRGFIWEGDIAAGVELPIANKISPIVPKYRIILRSDISDVTDGVNEWTKDFVYLKNNSGSTATLKVLFCL